MQKETKTRRIHLKLVPYVEKVFYEKGIAFTIKGEACNTALSSADYHDCVLAAMCDKQRNGKRTKVLSYNDFRRKQEREPSGSFISLEKDRDRILAMVS